MQRILITLGLVIASICIVYPYSRQIGLDQLTGDIIIHDENSTVFSQYSDVLPLVLFLKAFLIYSDPPNEFR